VRLPVVALLAGAAFCAASVLLTLLAVDGFGFEASGMETGFFFMRAVPDLNGEFCLPRQFKPV
jgi:hypothetical protein